MLEVISFILIPIKFILEHGEGEFTKLVVMLHNDFSFSPQISMFIAVFIWFYILEVFLSFFEELTLDLSILYSKHTFIGTAVFSFFTILTTPLKLESSYYNSIEKIFLDIPIWDGVHSFSMFMYIYSFVIFLVTVYLKFVEFSYKPKWER
jgi:hypothetical protein